MFVCYPMTYKITGGSLSSTVLENSKASSNALQLREQRRHLGLASPCSSLMTLPCTLFKASYVTLTISKAGDDDS